jgi:putative ABC transport system substrate-binding protein
MARCVSRRALVQGAALTGAGLLAGCGRLLERQAPPKVARIGLLTGASPATVPDSLVSPSFRQGTIPIVAVFSGDPVASGAVASLARPGGNVTGLTQFATQLGPKRLELLKEALPGLSRVAYLWDTNLDPQPGYEELRMRTLVQPLLEAADKLGLELLQLGVHEAGELDETLAVSRERAEALFFNGGPLFISHRPRVVALAAQHRLPAMYWTQEFVHAGGLMSYSANSAALFRRTAYYVDKILRGTSPADLPIEQPMLFDFPINLKTADALGLTIPERVLIQATEVIR